MTSTKFSGSVFGLRRCSTAQRCVGPLLRASSGMRIRWPEASVGSSIEMLARHDDRRRLECLFRLDTSIGGQACANRTSGSGDVNLPVAFLRHTSGELRGLFID